MEPTSVVTNEWVRPLAEAAKVIIVFLKENV